MAHYQVVIETREMQTGGFRATVAQGPTWAVGASVDDPDAQDAGEAASWLRMDVRALRPDDDVDFLRAES